jgi:hypothetical protein
VSARQRERGRAVVEGRRVPGSGRVTGGAIVIKIVGHVIGIGHTCEISLMAGIAVGRRVDVSRRMARNAGCGDVRSGQQETGSSMAEIGGRPSARSMAICARMAEICLNMVRIASRFKIALVTGIAIGRRAGIARSMTRGTGSINMLSGEREGSVGMVEG